MAKNKKSTPPKAAKKTVAKAKPATKVKKTEPAKAKKTAPVKKTVAKVAKKAAAPKKVVAKKPVVAKKETIKKAEPKAEPKKVVAAEPKKIEKVEKKVEKAAPVKKSEVEAAKVEKETEKAVASVTSSVKTVTPAPAKPAPPQLNIFPVPNQRPIAHKTQVPSPSTDNRTRYSDEELKEFENLINKKLDKAREEYKILKDTLNRNNDEGTDATSGGNTKVLEDGAETAEKENLSQLAARQQKYITNLENALIRIKNGTYGICSVTGKLIPKERLIAVPHTTQSIEAKMMKQD